MIQFSGISPNDLWVIEMKQMLAEIPRASKYFALSANPTINFEAYEVTPVTYRNMLIECKSRNMRNVWVPTTMIDPVLFSTILRHSSVVYC